MSDSLAKITSILLWVLMAVSAVFSIMLFIDGSDAWISNSIKFSYILTFLAAAFALIFGIASFVMKLVSSPKKALVTLLPILAFLGVILLAYNLASGEIMEISSLDEVFESSVYKWSGAGIYLTYILLILAVASIIFVEVSKFFKK